MHWKNITSIIILFLLNGCVLPVTVGQMSATPVVETEEVSRPDLTEITNEPQPSSTPMITPDVSETATITATLENTPTMPIVSTPTALPQSTIETPSYLLQSGSPVWLPDFSHPDNCNHQVVAGQVFDLEGSPVQNLIVEVKGQIEGEEIDLLTITGVAPIYGSGGYELVLSDHPVNSIDSLYLQIYDLTGKKVSYQVYFNTFADCSKNLVLMNFSQANLELIDQYKFIPFIYHNFSSPSSTPSPVP